MEAAIKIENDPELGLSALATCCGIDIDRRFEGKQRAPVEGEVLRKILAAMGVRAGSPEEIRESLLDLESGERRALKQVMTVSVDQTDKRISLTLPEGVSGTGLEWTIAEEGGATRAGTLSGSELVDLEIGRSGRKHLYFRLPAELPVGYHELRIVYGNVEDSGLLVVSPAECYLPEILEERRIWGVTAQLYSLRSSLNAGIGDFGDLERLLQICGEGGAELIGLNPLHATSISNPARCSPYFPVSRFALNSLYVDLVRLPDFAESELARRIYLERSKELEALRHAGGLDYRAVSELKLAVMAACFEHFRDQHLDKRTERAAAYERFCRAEGEALESYALFEAIEERYAAGGAGGWKSWPAGLRDRDGAALAEFSREHSGRLRFFSYLQWLAAEQLAHLGNESFSRHLGVGLMLDLALGSDPNGAETWANRALFAPGISVGAPPDPCNPAGQSWGFAPWIPERLREQRYRPLIELLRANMRHAGALRIDHVMSLWRLFWIPEGMRPQSGAYVHYPSDELLGILTLESQRNQCMLIGEDLGMVPDEVREGMRSRKIFSYSVLMFNTAEDGTYLPPDSYEELSVVTPNTHDLSTLEGFWEGRDIKLFHRHKLYAREEEFEEAAKQRLAARAALVAALRKEGVLSEALPCDPSRLPFLSDEVFAAVCAFLAKAPSRIMTIQLEDIIGQLESINLPGVAEAFPSWSHRLTVDLEALASHHRFGEMCRVLNEIRGRR